MSSRIITVRGVSIEAQNALKICAKKANKTQGKWLEGVILQAAKEMVSKKQEVARPDDVLDIIKQMSDKISAMEKMSDKIDELSNRLDMPWWRRIVK